MLLRVGYEMAFSFPQPTAMVLMLHVHPSRAAMIRKPERLAIHRSAGRTCEASQRVHTRLAPVDELASSRPGMFPESVSESEGVWFRAFARAS
jgi:hypothetical protein